MLRLSSALPSACCRVAGSRGTLELVEVSCLHIQPKRTLGAWAVSPSVASATASACTLVTLVSVS